MLRRLTFPGLISLALLAGCATTDSGSSAPTLATYSSFLSHPERLQPVPGNDGAYQWGEPDANLGQYNRILLERIQVQLAGDAEYKAIDPTDLKMLTDYFQQSIVKALGDVYPVVAKPGPGVLRVKVTIVDLVPTKPEMSVVTLVVPYATVVDMASGAMSDGNMGSPPYLGRTGIAAQFIDSKTGRVIAEYADTEVGQKYVVDTSKGVGSAISTGISDYTKAYSTWGYAQKAFDGWAQLLRTRLDEAHGR